MRSMTFSRAIKQLREPVYMVVNFRLHMVALRDSKSTILCPHTDIHELTDWVKNTAEMIVVYDSFKFLYNIKALTNITVPYDKVLDMNLVSAAMRQNPFYIDLTPDSPSSETRIAHLEVLFTKSDPTQVNILYMTIQSRLIEFAIKINLKPSIYYRIRDFRLWRIL